MRKTIITMQVDVTNVVAATRQIILWAQEPVAHYVCVSNVHMCIETRDNTDFRDVVNNADLVVADGRPIYWAQKILGESAAQQVRGMDLTLSLCKEAQLRGVAVGLYGASPETLSQFQKSLLEQFPGLNMVCSISPPFRALSIEEKQADIQRIKESGVQLLLVGLGCPKQERWMAEHKPQLSCVMVGVGAVFDFIAGNKKQAPHWMQSIGLEWLFRLLAEPKRLWRRYLYTNPKFICYFILQYLQSKK
jgi:N-acetylglucosaminyldiphosphoundecaprenol N-acetyl-beta-D-mannosaminyltransferase